MQKELKDKENSNRIIKKIDTVSAAHRLLYVGIDIGSISSDVVVLDQDENILFSDYQRTKANPLKVAQRQLKTVFERFNGSGIELAAATGTVGRLLAEILEINFVNEVPAQAAAICRLYPQLQKATIIEMGGQDSKLIFLADKNSRSRIHDFILNTACAAGTGSFLDQQAKRLGVSIEKEFGELALQSKTVPRVAGRCSVFAKSDMIHLQQQATPTCDIIAGLCEALARNLKSNVGSERNCVRPVIFTGGVAANKGIVKAIEKTFALKKDELIVPECHFFTGAIGAVLHAKNKADLLTNKLDVDKLEQYLRQRTGVLDETARLEKLKKPALPSPQSIVHTHLLDSVTEPIDAYLGVDVGSISTNVAVIDKEKRLLAKVYLMTAGKPLDAVHRGLEIASQKLTGKVKICGAGTTGSGRHLTGEFIGADIVINEITAQAAGTALVNPAVDTIFEIGGQDSKYISLQNGVVVDFEMNHACAAGTGSFLEEQSQRLDININKEFAELAFKSESPIKLGERCTVFIESDLLNYQQKGASTEDLVAGLSYSIVTNYLNRVVGRRKIGDNVCFQGGTAFNEAVWAAFEKIIGKPVMVPDHHEVTGAIGAALASAEYMNSATAKNPSKFRGFENLTKADYQIESFTCEHCPNNCEIKKVQSRLIEKPLYYGSRCDRYNVKKTSAKNMDFDAFEYRNNKLFEHAGLNDRQKHVSEKRPKIGIPLCLINMQLLPLFCQFLRSLGFEVITSTATDKRTIRTGVESVTAQPCFPVKVAYGHIAELLAEDIDYLFLPSIVSVKKSSPDSLDDQLCPYVQSFPYQIRSAFACRFGKTKMISVPLRMGEGKKLMQKSFIALGRELKVSRRLSLKAMKNGLAAQEAFESSLKEKGREILNKIASDERLYVLVSRPYNGCDDGLNLQLPKKMAQIGARIIPMEMLDTSRLGGRNELTQESVYWSYGQKILNAAMTIKNDPRLFAVYLSNFSCGPDSFILTFFKEIMNPKPCLQLELDEHSADTGIITRLEAFLESLKHCKPEASRNSDLSKKPPVQVTTHVQRRTFYLPYMGDMTYGLAAVLRGYGQSAEVLDQANEKSLLLGKSLITGKECLPCAITSGDMLKKIKDKNFNSRNAAFVMPGSCGPCRFGMYNRMHRLVLKYAGAEDVCVLSPNQNNNFYKEIEKSIEGNGKNYFVRDLWIGLIGVDLMGKVLLKLRPIAKDAEEVQNIYDRSLKQWSAALEKRSGLSAMTKEIKTIAESFAGIELDIANSVKKPRIGIVGEIYVRNHPFANNNLIANLEKLGAACELACAAEWIYYTNFTRINKAKRTGLYNELFINGLQDRIQHQIERKFAKPLENRFGPLAEEPIRHVIKLASPYLHSSFQGEAILSIGKMIELYHKGISGIINVMPFGCMPSTIVSSITRQISADCENMPILNLSYDGQNDSSVISKLEAFIECAGTKSPVHR